MAHLMQLITTALEWSYAEAQQDVSPKPLEAAAEPLTLRRDVLYLVDASERNEQDKDRHEEPPQVSPPK
jgi:hypothetical protein